MREKARAIADDIVRIRRDLHKHPELGYREERTHRRIVEELVQLGIDNPQTAARTGVVAELRRGKGATVALRADMDALPIPEAPGPDFASENPGVMHACGHDTHVAMLLGAARLLCNEEFQGTVRLVFQPSEENNEGDPDGFSGARRMLAEGVFKGVDAAVGLHQAPMLPTGCISIRDDAVLAAADRIRFEVRGRSAHAGVNPEAGIDAVLVASELVTLLQTVVSRSTGPNEQAVVSIGTIEGGSSYNVVADRVTLSGTTRALDDAVYERTLSRIREICRGLETIHGASVDFTVEHAVPVTRNDGRIAALARRAAGGIFPEGGVMAVPPMLGGEDFGYVAAQIPSVFAFLGTQPPKAQPTSLHHPKMHVDEAALPLGAAFLAQTALDLLRELRQAP